MKIRLKRIALLLAFGILIVTFLHQKSKSYINHKNPFIRVFPPHPISQWKVTEIEPEQTVVGNRNGQIYLSKAGVPNQLTSIQIKTLQSKKYDLKIDNVQKLAWGALQIKVNSNGIFLYEGITPTILYSNFKNKSPIVRKIDTFNFSRCFPLDSTNYILISYDKTLEQNILSKETLTPIEVIQKPNLLTKQVDGVFCSQGNLMYDLSTERIVYLYRYRNAYLYMDRNLNLLTKGNTIDTVSKAQIHVATYRKGKQLHHSLTAPPLIVNRSAALFDSYLYINSNLRASNEKRITFNKNSVIDVYSLADHSYQYSFYLPTYKGEKIQNFIVHKDVLVATYKEHLGIFNLSLPHNSIP
ncbi:hypothetical protein MQE36_14825 [Zhouia spongiae]|uniref:Uncharacterized protein n=1 Tax=Zhouia spongiae TaxID=2202721 RepID=A0ABY3YKK1_9FLAO|nr:hypothetical protein [Zhouia spongiae]UNY98347.1 hypothetical protein MQE36_14825 [Zhouia spongiae]